MYHMIGSVLGQLTQLHPFLPLLFKRPAAKKAYIPCKRYIHILYRHTVLLLQEDSICTCQVMEDGDQNNGNGNGNGSGGSRWNPTKEQITMLEGVYKQGLRTPTAEQIQQITDRLRAFGHIEGKNVFYWFQNHKARQRQKQKQKQENLTYLNRFLYPTPPLFHAYHHNVVCSPCYSIIPAKNDQLVYQQYPKVQPPSPPPTTEGLKRARLIPDRTETRQMYNKPMQGNSINPSQEYIRHHHHQRQQTLDLFPIHPTGLSQSTSAKENPPNKNNPISANRPTSCDNDEYSIFGNEGYGIDHGQQPCFNFFSGN